MKRLLGDPIAMGLFFWALTGFGSLVWKYIMHPENLKYLGMSAVIYGVILLGAIALSWKNLKYVLQKKPCRLCSTHWSPQYLTEDGLCGKCFVQKRMMDIEEGRQHDHQTQT